MTNLTEHCVGRVSRPVPKFIEQDGPGDPSYENAPASGPDVPWLARRAGVICAVLSILLGHCSTARAQDSSDVEKTIVPFVQKHCVHCHGEKKPKGDLSLHVFKEEGGNLAGTYDLESCAGTA